MVVCVYLHALVRWMKGSTGDAKARLNCWFCSEDVDVPPEEKYSWRCPSCEQYNGFTKDGDYIQPVREQFDVKEYKTPTVTSPSEFITAKSVLCESCSLNQVMKVRQLAAFTPFCEASYDDEIGTYKEYLDHRYSLCDVCSDQVSQYLSSQDQKLASTMKEEHLSLLEQVKERGQNGSGSEARLRQPVLARVMFCVCLCAGVVLVISKILSPIPDPHDMSYISQTATSVVAVLPDWFVSSWEQTFVGLGAASCCMGLLVAGKCSLYPEDAAHLMLWLVLVVMTFVLPFVLPTSSWLCVTRETMLSVSAVTVILSVVCCVRCRLPRHFTAATVHKKQICQSDLPVAYSSGNLQTENEDGEKVHSGDTSSSQTYLSSSSSNDRLQFDDVQQNLEYLSLGLAKRSESTSSVWSLPAIVSSSSMAPDSSADQLAQNVRQPRGVLTPSRLGFLKADVISAGRRTNLSSNWTQIRDNISTPSNARQTVAHMSILPQPELRQTEKTSSWSRKHKSAFRIPTSVKHSAIVPDLGPCDSQTPDITLLRLSTQADESCTWKHLSVPEGQPRYRLKGSVLVDSGYPSSGPRRSQRLAMACRQFKPWPLKKSLSCTNICSQANLLGSGSWRAKGLDEPINSRGGGGCVGDSENLTRSSFLSSNSRPNSSHFSPGGHMDRPDASNSRPTGRHFSPGGHMGRPDASNSRPTGRHISPGGHMEKPAGTPRHPVADFSDDESDDNLKQACMSCSTSQVGHGVSWSLMLVGVVMGASVTTNIFLLSSGWLAHTGWS